MFKFLLKTALLALILYSLAFMVNACMLVDFYSGGEHGCTFVL